jgi:hypothetical protein
MQRAQFQFTETEKRKLQRIVKKKLKASKTSSMKLTEKN